MGRGMSVTRAKLSNGEEVDVIKTDIELLTYKFPAKARVYRCSPKFRIKVLTLEHFNLEGHVNILNLQGDWLLVWPPMQRFETGENEYGEVCP